MSERPDLAQSPRQLDRQFAVTSDLREVGRRVLRLEIAPALECAAWLRGCLDHRLVQQDLASARRALANRLDRQDRLADQDHALEHPVERAALEDLGRALRGLARVDDRAEVLRLALRTTFPQVLRR